MNSCTHMSHFFNKPTTTEMPYKTRIQSNVRSQITSTEKKTKREKYSELCVANQKSDGNNFIHYK